MAYRLMSDRPLAQEVRRLLDQETTAATTCLQTASMAEGSHPVHDARKHLKKARAILQLTHRPLGKRYRGPDEELRVANRALGAIADARRSVETLAAARREGVVTLPLPDFSALRASLEIRAIATETGAVVDDVPGRTVRLIESLMQEIGDADLQRIDRDTIVAEIHATHGAARVARRRAKDHPTSDAYHHWRKLVKREWQLFRLIKELTGNRLRDERHQLAALDACLGELRDLDILVAALKSAAPLPRVEMAHLIARLRAQGRALRQRAHRLSPVLNEHPRALDKRVRHLWEAPPRNGDKEHGWQHSA